MRLLGLILLFSLVPALGPPAPPAATQPHGRQLAVTIDDGPVTRFFHHPSPWHRLQVVEGLLGALEAHRAPATLFVIGEDVEGNPEAEMLLHRWLAAGVEVGNHTHRHRNYDETPTSAYLADVDRASEVLRQPLAAHGRVLRYFRAPYLLDGGTADKQAVLARHLERVGLRNAPVTIAVEDWRYNTEYEAAERAEDWAERYEVGQAYLRHVLKTVEQFEALGREITGRDVAHVLLVHANTINRDYLGPILDALAARGYRFITLDEAYRDPLYRQMPPPSREGGSLLMRLAKASGLLADGS